MTNREKLIQSLQCEDADEYTVDYIACPHSCKFFECCLDDDNCLEKDIKMTCTECKMKWLKEER